MANRRSVSRWDRPQLVRFITEMAQHGAVSVQCVPRPDVQSRQWWTLTWTSEVGTKTGVVGQTLDILLNRAIALQTANEARDEDAWAGDDRPAGLEGLLEALEERYAPGPAPDACQLCGGKMVKHRDGDIWGETMYECATDDGAHRYQSRVWVAAGDEAVVKLLTVVRHITEG